VVQEAIRAATLVLIPARPGFLDLDSVQETVKTARDRNKPYAVVLNATPLKRDDKEAPAVAQSRAWLTQREIPVRAGQISQRAPQGYANFGIGTLAHDPEKCDRRAALASSESRITPTRHWIAWFHDENACCGGAV